MQFLGIDLATLTTPEFLDASNAQLGLWLKLNAYCASQENGGIILGAEAWSDQRWTRLIGVGVVELRVESPLWFFRSGSLMVTGYNLKQEEKMRQVRRAGRSKTFKKKAAARSNGRKGGRPKIIPIRTESSA